MKQVSFCEANRLKEENCSMGKIETNFLWFYWLKDSLFNFNQFCDSSSYPSFTNYQLFIQFSSFPVFSTHDKWSFRVAKFILKDLGSFFGSLFFQHSNCLHKCYHYIQVCLVWDENWNFFFILFFQLCVHDQLDNLWFRAKLLSMNYPS